MAGILKKSFNAPDEVVKPFERGEIDSVTIGGLNFQRVIFQPGWRWSKDMKPIAKTDSCQKFHVIYTVSGRLKVVADDGTGEEFGSGDLAIVHPGHDAWVVGKEPLVFLELAAAVKEIQEKPLEIR